MTRPRRPVRIARTFSAGIPPELQRIIRAQRQRASKPVRPVLRPATIGQEFYTRTVRTPLSGGYGSATISAGGTATVTIGPSGVGTVWYPQSAAIATSTGAADTSTCALYVGPIGLQTLIGAQSYAGGGDSVGLAVPPLFPGYFIVAIWSGGKAGDLATLTLYGQQESLVQG